jgi:hypothetical protein
MSSNGRALPNSPGRGSVSFSSLTSPRTVTLDKGAYVVLLSQVDANNPTGITITDAHGNVEYFNEHAAFAYMVGSYGCNPLTIDLVRPITGGGVDFVAINPAMPNEDVRSGGL